MVQIPRRRFSAGSINYDSSISANYSAGRALSRDAAEAWRKAIEPFIPQTMSFTILDIGAGTGRFSTLLAGFAGAHVVAVEPSRAMLATATRSPQRITYVAGRAERIPLRDQSCDVAWLSHVLHHIRDRARCARELRRVVRAGGPVLIRGTFADKLEGFPTLFRFFPGAREICQDLPTVAETVATFQRAGLTLEAHRPIQQRTCSSLREFADRTRRRADTSLALLCDAEFHAGQAAVESAALRESEPAPVLEVLELLVLRVPFVSGHAA